MQMQGENMLFQNAHGALTFAFNFSGQCYEPDNCRWATAKEQANNRRAPRKQGEKQ